MQGNTPVSVFSSLMAADPIHRWVPELGDRLAASAPSDSTVVLALVNAVDSCAEIPINRDRLIGFANQVSHAHPNTKVSYFVLGQTYFMLYYNGLKPSDGHRAIFNFKKYVAWPGVTKDKAHFATIRIGLTEELLKKPPKPDEIFDTRVKS